MRADGMGGAGGLVPIRLARGETMDFWWSFYFILFLETEKLVGKYSRGQDQVPFLLKSCRVCNVFGKCSLEESCLLCSWTGVDCAVRLV